MIKIQLIYKQIINFTMFLCNKSRTLRLILRDLICGKLKHCTTARFRLKRHGQVFCGRNQTVVYRNGRLNIHFHRSSSCRLFQYLLHPFNLVFGRAYQKSYVFLLQKPSRSPHFGKHKSFRRQMMFRLILIVLTDYRYQKFHCNPPPALFLSLI